MFLPETFRLVIDNDAQQSSGLHEALISYLRILKVFKLENGLASADSQNSHEIQSPESPSKRFRFPNPMVSLRMLRAKDLALIITIYVVYYMNFSCLQASLSPIFIALYNFSELNAGLIYLPFEADSVTSVYCSNPSIAHYFHAHFCVSASVQSSQVKGKSKLLKGSSDRKDHGSRLSCHRSKE